MELYSCAWPSLPGEVLGIIARKIISIDDYVRFTTVCRSWYLIAIDLYNNFKHELNLGPLYMSATDPVSNHITLRNPASDDTLTLHSPETAGAHCWGSPFGWLITYDHTNLGLSLVNPFTGATILLPPLPEGGLHWDRLKAFLTANPDSDPDDCLVVINSRSGKLAFVKPAMHMHMHMHGTSWSHVRGNLYLFDLTYSVGNWYGLQFSSGLEVLLFLFESNHRQNDVLIPRFVHILTLDLTPFQEILTIDLCPYWEYSQGSTFYSERRLVDLNGELCLCLRLYNKDSSYLTVDYKFFKIDLFTGNLTQIVSLGDHCLFLSNNYSFSYKAAYPRTKLFEQPRCERHEFVNNYVFYTYYNDWLLECHHPSYHEKKRPFDVEVWDMFHSNKVDSEMDSKAPLYATLWILPFIKFHRHENDSQTSTFESD